MVLYFEIDYLEEILSHLWSKYTSSQFVLRSQDFFFTRPCWFTYNTTLLPFNLISYFFFLFFSFFFLFFFWKWRHYTPWSLLIFSFYFSSWLSLYPLWGCFQILQMSSLYLRAWILESVWEFCLTNDSRIYWPTSANNYNDLSQTRHVDNKIWACQKIIPKRTKSTL